MLRIWEFQKKWQQGLAVISVPFVGFCRRFVRLLLDVEFRQAFERRKEVQEQRGICLLYTSCMVDCAIINSLTYRGILAMLDQTFGQVYTKFKLHFYKQIFNRFEDREATLTTVESFCRCV